jgi:hypothetical protein
MKNEELQEQINTLSQQQLALAKAVNQFGSLSSNGGTPLEVDPHAESSGDFISALEDFTTRSRNYKNYARTRGRWLLRFLASPAALDSLRAAAAKGLPAVAGIAEGVVQLAVLGGNVLTAVDRQFLGSVVRYRMEATGYRKAEKKALFRSNHLHGASFTNRSQTSNLTLLLSCFGCHGRTWDVCCFAPYALAEVVAAKHKGLEVDSLGAFMRVCETGSLCCVDDQSGFSRLGWLVLFPLNLGPAFLLSSGDLGSSLIAHAAPRGFFCWEWLYLGCLSHSGPSLRCNSFTFQTQGACLLQGVDAAIDFSQYLFHTHSESSQISLHGPTFALPDDSHAE